MEIERKFLVVSPPPGLEHHPHEQISQGYLLPSETSGSLEVRVRRKAENLFLTIKHGQGLSRTEVELPLPQADFDALWPLTVGRRIEKVRYRLPHGGADLTVELDVYTGALAGLHTAEVEFPTEAAAAAFQPPAYFGREVTENPAYRNASLARHGLPGD